MPICSPIRNHLHSILPGEILIFMHHIYLSIKPKPIFLLPQNIITLKLYHH